MVAVDGEFPDREPAAEIHLADKTVSGDIVGDKDAVDAAAVTVGLAGLVVFEGNVRGLLVGSSERVVDGAFPERHRERCVVGREGAGLFERESSGGKVDRYVVDSVFSLEITPAIVFVAEAEAFRRAGRSLRVVGRITAESAVVPSRIGIEREVGLGALGVVERHICGGEHVAVPDELNRMDVVLERPCVASGDLSVEEEPVGGRIVVEFFNRDRFGAEIDSYVVGACLKEEVCEFIACSVAYADRRAVGELNIVEVVVFAIAPARSRVESELADVASVVKTDVAGRELVAVLGESDGMGVIVEPPVAGSVHRAVEPQGVGRGHRHGRPGQHERERA